MQELFLFVQNQKLLVSILVVAVLLLTILEFIRQKKGGARVSPATAIQMINHQNAVILDIRPTDAFASGHIVDAISLPLADLESKHKKIEKYKSKPMIVACASGLESPKAASILKNHGFNVWLLSGGVRGWKEADLPLIKG